MKGGLTVKIRIQDIRLPVASAAEPECERELLLDKISKLLRVSQESVEHFSIYRKSPDLRIKSAPLFVYTVDAEVRGRPAGKYTVLPPEKAPVIQKAAVKAPDCRPVVVGFGPAGMFAALVLAEAGLCPIILERGGDVESRTREVRSFWTHGVLDPESNVQFGEGGAGTFSDGKLNTLIRDKETTGRLVLETFVKFGAPAEILYWNKPHIGTDILRKIVKNIREYIISLGAEVRFRTRMTEIRLQGEGASARVSGIMLQDGTVLAADCIFLAVGHSARDTFAMLKQRNIAMERKPFSVGVRIEHLQSEIDAAQYGSSASLMRSCSGPADYKLSHRTAGGRGVYTFCMCPGGVVVGAASEQGGLVTNGMSNYDRAERNANSALLVSIYPEDFTGGDVLGGVEFQRQLERAAFARGGGTWKAPCQLVGDFLAGRASRTLGKVEPSFPNGYCLTELGDILPDAVREALQEGICAFGKRIAGFDRPDAVLTGCETRSSSPVRILRDDNGRSVSAAGLYPVGEGAGYAGGIVSAAADGIKAVEKWLDTL